IAETGDENGNDLRVRVFDQFADAGLRTQIRIRIVAAVAPAFGVKAYHIACAFAAKLSQAAKRVLVELALLRNRFITGGEERRVPRPPTHNQVNEHTDRRLIKEAASDRKEKLLAPTRATKQNGRDGLPVKEGTMN